MKLKKSLEWIPIFDIEVPPVELPLPEELAPVICPRITPVKAKAEEAETASAETNMMAETETVICPEPETAPEPEQTETLQGGETPAAAPEVPADPEANKDEDKETLVIGLEDLEGAPIPVKKPDIPELYSAVEKDSEEFMIERDSARKEKKENQSRQEHKTMQIPDKQLEPILHRVEPFVSSSEKILVKNKPQGKNHAFIRHLNTGTIFRIPSDGLVIGSSLKADYIIDFDHTISRRHLLLYYDGDNLVAEDLGSKNKSYLNYQEITQPVIIRENDILRLAKNQIFQLIVDKEDKE